MGTEPEKLEPDQAVLLVQIAEMYYLQGMTQAEIARQLGVNRIRVNRLLKRARQVGVVRVTVVNPLRPDERAGQALAQVFGLRKAVVVPAASEDQAVLARHLARAAVPLLDELVPPKAVIGIGWGASVRAFVDEVDGAGEVKDITVVPLLGGVGPLELPFQINELVRRLAEKLHASWQPLNAPFLVERPEVLEALVSDGSIRGVVRLWDNLDVAIVGIGCSIGRSPMLRTDLFANSDIVEMEQQGAVGDICSRFFTTSGRSCSLSVNKRLVAITLEQIRRVPTVIAIAGGMHKVPAIMGALSGGYVNVLVTDHRVAESLLDWAGAVKRPSPGTTAAAVRP